MYSRKNIGKIFEKESTIEWAIENYFSYSEDLILVSPDFKMVDSIWNISIAANEEYVKLALNLRDFKNPRKVEFRLILKSVMNNDIEYEIIDTKTFDSDAPGWGQNIIKKAILSERKMFLVPGNVLSILCNISEENASGFFSCYGNLAADIKELFTSQINTDVKLIVQGETFSAHKIILQCRSPVFTAMFNNNMEEKNSGVVHIFDCEPRAFNQFLIYLYAGECNFKECHVCDLYHISEKYDVKSLSSICVEFMSKNLSVQNFGEILILADKFNDTMLLKQVQNYFIENFDTIVSSNNWECLIKENFEQANELLLKKAISPKIKLK